MRLNWDLFMTVILFYVFFVTPYRLAFVDEESLAWRIGDYGVDFIFLLDIMLTFFSAYYNSKFILIDKRTTIAISYVTSWFLIDIVAIFPFDLFFQ